MCGRYTLTKSDLDILKKRFRFFTEEAIIKPRFNIAPSQQAPVILYDGENLLKFLKWGLVPSWAKEEAIGYKMINARSETLNEKPTFKKSFKQKRCLVPSDGWYEWKVLEGKKAKQPMRITLSSKEPFAFAGLWDTWKKPDGSSLESFTIVTTSASDSIKPIHDRMPVILQKKDEEMWLDSSFQETDKLSKLLMPYPSDLLESYPVSTLVNTPKNDGPECVEPLTTR